MSRKDIEYVLATRATVAGIVCLFSFLPEREVTILVAPAQPNVLSYRPYFVFFPFLHWAWLMFSSWTGTPSRQLSPNVVLPIRSSLVIKKETKCNAVLSLLDRLPVAKNAALFLAQ
jgi:hypothetical protein